MRRPTDLGLPDRFHLWRQNQLDAVLTAASGEDGSIGLNMPTGSGKSLVYMAVAKLLGGRTVILTSTKGLQDQIGREFGTADVRGQVNFECELEKPVKVQVNDAICHLGVPCHLKGGGCTYFDAYRRAVSAPTVVTNYAYWMSVHEYAEGLGGFDTMVMDEAHSALDELGSHLSTHITDVELDAFLDRSKPHDDKPKEWGRWASAQLRILEPKLNAEVEELKKREHNRSLMRRVHEIKRIVKKLKDVQLIGESQERWVYEAGDSLDWTPVWPGRGSSALFRGIRKVLLVSATLTRKSMDLLGLQGYRFHEYPSAFDVRNRPVIHLRTGVRLRHDTDRIGLKAWLDKIDQIIQFRQDRKGIIHTVSYARRDYIMERSRFRGMMITHNRRDTRAKVEEFKRMQAPAILVSPSMDTGWDFKDDEARWQIIAKVPFPDSRSPVHAARQKDDKDFGMHVAMTTLVQAAGRIVRSERDWGETFVLDDQIAWFCRKYRRFAPRWFMDALQLDVMVTPPRLR